jgi:hypothetical protein
MQNYIYSTLFFLILTACQKQKSFKFPHGEWVLTNFVVNGTTINGYKCTFKTNQFDHLLVNCSFSFDNKNHLNYYSNKNDELKIIEINQSNNSRFFTLNNYFQTFNNTSVYSYSSIENFDVSVKTKKQKKLILSYSLINDSTLIGVFWEKGQAIERFDAPNFCTGTFDLYNTNIKGELKINFKSEILGVYHLKK